MRKAKIKEVPVHNLADLVEIVNLNADSFGRQIKRISKNSRRISVLSGVVAALVIYSTNQRQKLEEQIYQLSLKVKKLERDEEE